LRKRRNTDFIWFFIIAAGVFALMFFVLTPHSPIPTVLVLAAVTCIYILLAERKTRRMAQDAARKKKAAAHKKHKLSRRRDAEFGKVIEFPNNKATR
jgi:uncharacterized membrane protein (DUF106 family)